MGLACKKCGQELKDALASSCPRCGALVGSSSETMVAEAGASGTVVGQFSTYELGRLIGRGGMCDVHEGRDVNADRPVAIKVLPAELAREKAFTTRFSRELDVLRKLDHPNIIKILDWSDRADRAFIVMELLAGSLETELARGRLSAKTAIELTTQAARALSHAHRNGIIHRDIKPANIMLDHGWNVKVTDFGIARLAEGTILTQTGGILGTPAYMSPEQSEGRHVDRRTDIYGLGVVLYEMLAGKPPFSGNTQAEVLQKHRFHLPEAPREYNPEIPGRLSDLVLKMLEKEPAKRVASMDAVIDELAAIEKQRTSTLLVTQAVKVREAPKPSRARLLCQILGLVLMAGIGGGLIWYLWPREPPPVQMYQRGLTLMQRGDLIGARRLFERVVAAAPASEYGSLASERLAEVEIRSQRRRAELSEDLRGLFDFTMDLTGLSQKYPDIRRRGAVLPAPGETRSLEQVHFEDAQRLEAQGDLVRAAMAYRYVATVYSDTEWGAKAREKLEQLKAQIAPAPNAGTSPAP